jgi:hypothetical protein
MVLTTDYGESEGVRSGGKIGDRLTVSRPVPAVRCHSRGLPR